MQGGQGGTADPGRPAETRKLIRDSRAKLRLAAGSILVLALGWLLAPGAAPQPPPEEKVAPMLAAAAERQGPARLFHVVQEAGRAALEYSVAFAGPDQPQLETETDFGPPKKAEQTPSASGMLVSEGQVLTHVAALSGGAEPMARLADGTKVSARVRAYDAGTGLVLLQLAQPTAATGAPLASAPPSPGALMVAAARFEQGDLLVPLFVGKVDGRGYAVTATPGLLPPGTPIYNLSGEAVAVAADQSSLAHPVSDALSRLRGMAAQGSGLPRTIGVCLQPVTPVLAGLVGAGGVLVSDVQDGGPADRAGLRPGDVIVRVAGVPTPTVEAVRLQIASLPPAQATTVTARRQGKERELEVRAEETLALDPCGQRPVPTNAPEARRIFSAAQLATAGLSDDALVLAVDGAPVAERTLPSLLRRRGEARLFHVLDGARRRFAVIGGEE